MSSTYPFVSLGDVSRLNPASTLILSVNNRHARRILAELSASLGAEQKVMAVPDIMPLGAWLAQAADHLSFLANHDLASHTADSFGAQYLWRRVISDVESDDALLDTAQAARLASEADRLMDDWRITVEPDEETADHQRFLAWRARYRELLSARDVEDSNLAYERVCQAVSRGDIDLPVQNIVLAGFNDLSPRLAELLRAMQDQGAALFMLDHSGPPARQVQRISVSDTHAEWKLAAQWACDQLRQNPEGHYAIVAPNLESNVPLAHRVLQQALGSDGFAFNIAVGRPLSEWPLVRAALAWLRVVARCNQGRRSNVSDLGQALLAGGCVAHAEEASRRALLDARWRRRAVIELSPVQFSEALTEHVPLLGAAWQDCMVIAGEYTGVQSPVQWAAHLRRVLQALGFPGDTTLDSHAYQTLEAFDQLIDRLGQQSPITGELEFAAVVGLLSRLANELVFQPQRDSRSRLDVLGFLESEGGRWDGVWVLGLTDEVLPASPQPNPLIPLAAQRRTNAPRATPERELQWAHSIYGSLLTCAPQVWLSHPQRDGERELRASPCITELAEHRVEPSQDLQPAWPLEHVVDDQGPPVGTADPAKGGIALIDAQARNPLWAFARFRLGAAAMPDYATLADQSVRGQFLHRAMELLWRLFSGQGSLRQLVQEGRASVLVEQVTAQAADEWLVDFGPVLRQLELARAHDIIMRWLELELQRDPFEIEAIEKRELWTHAGLQLSVRLDRVDRLADGRLAVIDYKSGAGTVDPRRSWMRDRPIDLQLPFYAAVLTENVPGVAALVLAQLHARTTDTTGISDGDLGLSGVVHFTSWEAFENMSWDQVLTGWKQTIQGMADEFSQGHAANHFVDRNDLRYCDVLPFLRLTEEYPGDDQTAQ